MEIFSQFILPFILGLTPLSGLADIEPAQTIDFEPGSELPVTLHGARNTKGFVGSGLEAKDGSYAIVSLKQPLRSDGGAIGLWVRPLWPSDDKRSHTLLSLRWTRAGDEFMALSQGFFEKEHGRALQFVVNNRHMACRADDQLPPGVWTHVLASWGQGREAICKLYLNGRKVGMTAKRSLRDYSSTGPLFIGGDMGMLHPRGRPADTIVDTIELYSGEVTEDEAWALYGDRLSTTNPVSLPNEREQYPWISEVLGAKPESPLPRDENDVPLEMRAVFDPDIQWAVSRHHTDAIVKWTKDTGFNVLVTPVWQGRGARFPTSSAPIEQRLEARIARGDDPLAYLLKRAHESGIQVYAWFNVVQRRAEILPDFYDEGTPDDAFDVHNPRFRSFIVQLILEVANRYPIDGINLDHIRSMGFCSSKSCREDYDRTTGGNLKTDLLARRVSKEASARLARWNAAAVRDIVVQVSEGVREINPDIVLSVDAHPLHTGLRLQGQESVQWANEGLIDRIFNMDYHTKPDLVLIDKLNKALERPAMVTMLFGTYEVGANETVPRSPSLITNYVRIARQLLPNSGVAFYHRKQISDAQARTLASTVFATQARPQ